MNAASLVTIGALLLTSVALTGARDESFFNSNKAFYLLCRFQESFRLEIYSFTEETQKSFTADSVMSHAIRDRGSMFDASNFRNTSGVA